MNEDLVGYEWTNSYGVTMTVVAVCPWDSNYLEVEYPGFRETTQKTTRAAALVRRRKELDTA